MSSLPRCASCGRPPTLEIGPSYAPYYEYVCEPCTYRTDDPRVWSEYDAREAWCKLMKEVEGILAREKALKERILANKGREWDED